MLDNKILDKTGRHDQITASREYYDGIHDTQLTERQRKYLQIKTGQEFNDNYCSIVVDALAERLSVAGFDVAGDKDIQRANEENSGDKLTQAETFQRWWALNRMDAKQGDIHVSAVRDGDAYCITEWDNVLNIPEWSFEMAYDGQTGVEVVFSDEKRDQIEYAFKRWKTASGDRLNIYYPNRVEKYRRSESITTEASGFMGLFTKSSTIVNWTLESTDDWVDEDGKPLGVPVAHFKNGGGGYSYGQSEIRDVIPQQNALNKAIIDTIAAADTTGFRMYFMIGDDPSGLNVVPGSWVYSTQTRDKVEIGHIPGEDLSKLIEFKDSFAMEIARVSRTPLSFFQISRQLAAEGTLKQQEAGLVSRVKNRHVTFGNAYEDMLAMARKLAVVFGEQYDYLDQEAAISTKWQDPETRNDKTQVDIAVSKVRDLGLPSDQVWGEMGYTPEQVAEFKEMPEHRWWNEKEMWQALAYAVQAGIPAETFLMRYGWGLDDLKELGTQRLAAIRLAQEDVIPTDRQ